MPRGDVGDGIRSGGPARRAKSESGREGTLCQSTGSRAGSPGRRRRVREELFKSQRTSQIDRRRHKRATHSFAATPFRKVYKDALSAPSHAHAKPWACHPADARNSATLAGASGDGISHSPFCVVISMLLHAQRRPGHPAESHRGSGAELGRFDGGRISSISSRTVPTSCTYTIVPRTHMPTRSL